MMRKYLLITLGFSLLIFSIFITNNQYNYKNNYKNLIEENNQIIKGKVISSDHRREIYLNVNQVIVKDKINNEINYLSLPESDFKDISVVNNKLDTKYPLIGTHIKYGIKLVSKSNIYLVNIEPQMKIISSYPNPKTGNDKIIIDKNKNILYFYYKGEFSRSYQVATGKNPEYTPEGTFKIINKAILPNGDAPDSLYGPRWMGLSVPYEKDLRAKGKKDLRAPQGHKYGIHGTNEPNSIGTHASGGCIRMNNKDVTKFFDMVKTGTIVDIIKNPSEEF